jgi:hypothetical protein
MSDCRRGFGFEIEFIDHLQAITTITITLSLISTLYKSLQHTLSFPVCCVFTSRSLITASNSGDSSASALTSFLSLLFTDFVTTLCYNCLTSKLVSVMTSRHGPCRKHRTLLYSNSFRGNMFVCEGVTQ